MKKEQLPLQRPTNKHEIQSLQRRAYDLAKKGDYESALALCDWLIQEAKTRVAGLRQRAAVLEHQGEIELAIKDLEVVVSAGVDEPADMHNLGMLYLQEQRDHEAEQIFAKGIQICVHENAPYYLNSCKLLRAEALLRTGRGDIALTELETLPDDYSAYVYGRGLRTKAALVDEARQKK